jgi:hypothetical protein
MRSGLVRFLILVGIMTVMSIILVVLTEYLAGDSAPTRVLGMPLTGITPDEPCILTLGGGVGVIVVGVGVGVVAFTMYGAGILFATGQVVAGCIAFGQAGIGLVFFGGQVGAGVTGVGQGILGVHTVMDDKGRGKPFLVELNRDLGKILKPTIIPGFLRRRA